MKRFSVYKHNKGISSDNGEEDDDNYDNDDDDDVLTSEHGENSDQSRENALSEPEYESEVDFRDTTSHDDENSSRKGEKTQRTQKGKARAGNDQSKDQKNQAEEKQYDEKFHEPKAKKNVSTFSTVSQDRTGGIEQIGSRLLELMGRMSRDPNVVSTSSGNAIAERAAKLKEELAHDPQSGQIHGQIHNNSDELVWGYVNSYNNINSNPMPRQPQVQPGPYVDIEGSANIPISGHALQDYQMQLMLLEQQHKKRVMLERQEQELGGVFGPRTFMERGGIVNDVQGQRFDDSDLFPSFGPSKMERTLLEQPLPSASDSGAGSL